jgi:hypothetical protein
MESLDGRDTPSVTVPDTFPVGGTTPSEVVQSDNKNNPPVITDFVVQEVGFGTFVITGRVADENPGGLTVTIGGSTSCTGQTTTTNADGTFTITVRLRTDGSDEGWITAVAEDAGGLESNEAAQYVKPTTP